MMFKTGQVSTTKTATQLSVHGGVRYTAVIPAALGLMLLWPFGDSAKKVSMTPGKEDPAAHGTVAVKTGRNGNTDVSITAKSLAQPSALNPPENTYVVWFQPDGQDARNMGALRVNNNLDGKLVTVSPYRRFKVFITAEKEPNPTRPKGPTMLTADVLG
jgi:hypothetical protein